MSSIAVAASPPASARTEPVTASAAPPAARVEFSRVALQDFRNIQRLDRVLPSSGMVLVGENGHGKTNFLEALYYAQLLRSVRGAQDTDLVRFGAAGFHVAVEVGGGRGRDGGVREIAVGFERSRDGRGRTRKRVLIDGGEVTRMSDALGAVPTAMLSPRDTSIVSGSPADRRRFIDMVLALSSRPYLAALQRYRGALLRRNAALRDIARTGKDPSAAAAWEPLLAEHGATVWSARREWVAKAAGAFATLCSAMEETGAVELRYQSSLSEPEEPHAALLDALASQRHADIRRGMTQSGPHRDDLTFLLDGREMRVFGSGGQHRTAAIALRMLEADTLRRATASEPVLLLDDPFAELDSRRAVRILELLRGSAVGQVFLAIPRAADIPPALSRLERWHIARGELRVRTVTEGGRRKPTPLKDVLSTVLERSGLAPRIEQNRVLSDWASIVGPQIAAATEPQTIGSDGTLFVGVRGHAWMSELSLLEPEILAAINARMERSPIRRIHWRLATGKAAN